MRHSVSSPEFVKSTPLRVVFSTPFSLFYLAMKHCVSFLKYYVKRGFSSGCVSNS